MRLMDKLQERLNNTLTDKIADEILEHVDFEAVIERSVEELMDGGAVSMGSGNLMEQAARRIEEQLVEHLTIDIEVDELVDGIDISELLDMDGTYISF